jgi:hypothetical protein
MKVTDNWKGTSLVKYVHFPYITNQIFVVQAPGAYASVIKAYLYVWFQRPIL